MQNRYKILGLASILSIIWVTFGSINNNTLSLDQSSVEKIKKLNAYYQFEIYPLSPGSELLNTPSLTANIFQDEDKDQQKGLIVSVKGEDDIFLLQPKKELSIDRLDEIAKDYASIPELESVERDQSVELMEEEDSIELPVEQTLETSVDPVLDQNKVVRIGIFDSGLDESHPDLKSIFIDKGWDGIENKRYEGGDEIGHGTHVTGIIAKKTPNAQIVPYKVASIHGGRLSNLVVAMQKAIDEGNLDLINMSFGFSEPSKILEKMIQKASEKGIIVVAAAGNKSNSSPFYPAYYDQVIAVGGATRGGKTVSTSNFGDWVDVAGLGHFVLSSLPHEQHGIKSGTSQAAGFVTGYISNLLADSDKKLSEADVLSRLNEIASKVKFGPLKNLSLIQ